MRKVDAEGASSVVVGGWGWEQLIHCHVMVVHPHCWVQCSNLGLFSTYIIYHSILLTPCRIVLLKPASILAGAFWGDWALQGWHLISIDAASVTQLCDSVLKPSHATDMWRWCVVTGERKKTCSCLRTVCVAVLCMFMSSDCLLLWITSGQRESWWVSQELLKRRKKRERERRFYLFITLKTLPTFITAHHLVKTVTYYKLIIYSILCLTPRKQHCMFELDTVLCLTRYGIDITFVSQHQFVLWVHQFGLRHKLGLITISLFTKCWSDVQGYRL